MRLLGQPGRVLRFGCSGGIGALRQLLLNVVELLGERAGRVSRRALDCAAKVSRVERPSLVDDLLALDQHLDVEREAHWAVVRSEVEATDEFDVADESTVGDEAEVDLVVRLASVCRFGIS